MVYTHDFVNVIINQAKLPINQIRTSNVDLLLPDAKVTLKQYTEGQ